MSTTYNLQTKDGVDLTSLSVWNEQYGIDDYRLKFLFSINFEQAFLYAKILGAHDELFAKQLHELQNKFYDVVSSSIEKNIIKCKFNEKEATKIFGDYDTAYHKILDYFLPIYKSFANKWGLGINED